MTNAFRCGDKNEEHDLNEIIIEGLDESIRQSMKGCWALCKTGSLYDLEFRATSFLK